MPRGRKSRPGGQPHASPANVPIPDKLYFRIGEVSNLTQTAPYVLRYWETEFPTFKPPKSRSGHRLYRRKDVETVFEIKRLLYEEGFTIEGARRKLAGDSQPLGGQKPPLLSTVDGMQLRAIKRELQNILTILSRKC